MNFINKTLLLFCAFLTFNLQSQDSIKVDPAELMNSYNEAVSKLAETYLNISFLSQIDSLGKSAKSIKISIPNKDSQIQGLVMEINKKLPVTTFTDLNNLTASLEKVNLLLATALEQTPGSKSLLMKDAYMLSASFILKSLTNRNINDNTVKDSRFLPEFWMGVFVISILIISLCLSGFLIYFRYESKKHIKKVTALILATSIEQEK